jgi:hypothetical protein
METPDTSTVVLSGATLALLIKEAFAWMRSRSQKTEISPTPLPVEKADKYVTRGEFNRHVEANARDHAAMAEDNARDHENMFARLNANDKLTSKLEGILSGIREDLSAIKDKMFRRKC